MSLNDFEGLLVLKRTSLLPLLNAFLALKKALYQSQHQGISELKE
jgi:hypothetical protein